MAAKKDKSAPGSNGKEAGGRAPALMAVTSDTATVLATPEAASMQRLLREAAWSRMFGRTEARNPFARSR
ncbi:MAG TPA: hypothetical protein VMB73_26760 [Acetobacteraceae bacterium]|jgi:hypothetical protein|nr:hypothetical protein [Acetobacteraceae bacterium]